MIHGFSNADIADEIKKPLSTIQRRSRRLITSGLIEMKYRIDYKKLGYKKGFLHVYLKDGKIYEVAERLRNIDHVLSVSIHIGNSDVVAEYVTLDSSDLLTLMAAVKHMPTVDRVVWSEEVTYAEAAKPILPGLDKFRAKIAK
jgi:DNA-binding Lrp family transcriptional regulator